MHVHQEIRNANVGIKDWISFVDRNSENIDSINYGTGENSLLDDWYEFVSYVFKNYPDIKQAITTNGTMYEMMMANPKIERDMKGKINDTGNNPLYKDPYDRILYLQ